MQWGDVGSLAFCPVLYLERMYVKDVWVFVVS